jgi:hypothetical protein
MAYGIDSPADVKILLYLIAQPTSADTQILRYLIGRPMSGGPLFPGQ